MTNSLTKYLDLKLSSYQCSSILLDFFFFFSIICTQLSATMSHKPRTKRKTNEHNLRLGTKKLLSLKSLVLEKNPWKLTNLAKRSDNNNINPKFQDQYISYADLEKVLNEISKTTKPTNTTLWDLQFLIIDS